MGAITLRPTMIEYGVNGASYDQLVTSLREAGHDVRLDDPDERPEYRSIPGDVVQAAVDVAVFVDAHFHEAEALAALVVLLRKALRSRSRRRREAVIYGERGQVLRRVKLSGDDDG